MGVLFKANNGFNMGSLKVHCVHFKGGSVFKVSAKLLSAKCSVTGWFLSLMSCH